MNKTITATFIVLSLSQFTFASGIASRFVSNQKFSEVGAIISSCGANYPQIINAERLVRTENPTCIHIGAGICVNTVGSYTFYAEFQGDVACKLDTEDPSSRNSRYTVTCIDSQDREFCKETRLRRH